MKILARFFAVVCLSVSAIAQQPQAAEPNPEAIVNGNYQFTNGVAPGYWIYHYGTASLVVHVGKGTCFDSSEARHAYAGGTLTMTASATNYIYLATSSCTLSQNTSGYPVTGALPLATVVATSSVTSITDDRTWFNGLTGGQCPLSAGVNAKTSGYTLDSTDAGKLVTFSGSSLTATLPASPPSANWCARIQNLNASSLTVSRNSLLINGGSSNLTLAQYQTVTCVTDNSNYFCTRPIVAGSNVTITESSNQESIASSALSTPVSVANGGTGLGTLTAHAVLLGEGTSNVAFAPVVGTGKCLMDNGLSSDPTFQACPSGSGVIPCLGTGAAYASTILGEGSLVNYWRMNDTVGSTTITDSKDSNTGTVVGSVTFGNSGCMGDAAHFPGGSDFITVSRSIQDDFTIEFWLKTTVTPGCASTFTSSTGQGLVGGEVPGVTNDFGVLLGNYACTGSSGNIVAGTGNPDTNVSSVSVNDGSWHYVVFTRIKSSGSIKLYVDNTLQATAGAGTQSLTAPSTLYIGADQCCFNGYMQHLAFYSSALGTTQINAHWLAAGGISNGGSITEIDTGTGLTGGPITEGGTISLITPVSVANGGTGNSSPSLVNGTGISVSGSWPNQTINHSNSVTAGACGDATHSCTINYDAQGHITSVVSNLIPGTSSGAYTQLCSGTISSSTAALLFDASNNCSGAHPFTSTYKYYDISCDNLSPTSGSNTNFAFRVGTVSGYDSGANYGYSIIQANGATNFVGEIGGDSGQTQAALTSAVTSTHNGGAGELQVYNPTSASTNKFFTSNFATLATDAHWYTNPASERYISNTALQDIEFLFTTGNIATATCTIWGRP